MKETMTPQTGMDHTRAVIFAVTIILMTCILSCAAVLIILILRTS